MVDRPELAWRTRGEQLFLWRARKCLTQEEAARILGVSEYAYNRAENDRSRSAPARSVKPRLGELCALARRRHGLSLRATACLLGMSHVTLLRRERESDPALVARWRGVGYRF